MALRIVQSPSNKRQGKTDRCGLKPLLRFHNSQLNVYVSYKLLYICIGE